MSRQQEDNAEYFVEMCRRDRERYPLSPLPRTPKRRVSHDFAIGAVDRYDHDGAVSFLLQPQAG